MEKEADMSGIFYHITCISKYSKEEFDAMSGKIPMTEKIFEKCVGTALSLCDYEYIRYLTKTYPEFLKNSKLLKDKEWYFISR